MSNIVSFLLLAALLILGWACGATPKKTGTATVIYAQAGQTVKEAVDSLPATGGTVILGPGIWTSGYGATDFIARPYITIQGSGMPGYNSPFTEMSGGTIVQGHLSASAGADYFSVGDLGVDAGPAYINANNGGVAMD